MEQQKDEKRSKPRMGVAAAAGLLLLLALGAAAALRAALEPAAPNEGLASSQAVYDRRGRLLRLDRTPDGKLRVWTPLREVSPLMVRATDLQELDAPRSPGASPLATSVAALKYGLQGRSLADRARLAVRAWQVQAMYSRERQLELYLNLAGYGGAIQGVGAASLIYYDKNADQLNLSEALTLSVIPRHPLRRALAGRPNRGDQTARAQARRRLSSRWERPAGGPVAAAPSESVEFWRRLVRQAGRGPVVSLLDRGLERLSQRSDQEALLNRLDDGTRD